MIQLLCVSQQGRVTRGERCCGDGRVEESVSEIGTRFLLGLISCGGRTEGRSMLVGIVGEMGNITAISSCALIVIAV